MPDLLGEDRTRSAKIIKDSDSEKYVEISWQELFFDNKKCIVLQVRDITKVLKSAALEVENKMLTIYTQTMSHELLTPLTCLK